MNKLNSSQSQPLLFSFIREDPPSLVQIYGEKSFREKKTSATLKVPPQNGRFFWKPTFSALIFGYAKLSRQCNGDFASKTAPKMILKTGSKKFDNHKYRPREGTL